MGALDSTEWELFLRKMIARNLRIFGAPDPASSKDGVERLREWNLAQVGLHSIITFETGIKKVAEQEQSKWQFEEEIKALGAEEVQAEFAGYFTSIVSELGSGNVKYSEAVRQLEGLLELERETLSVKRKVAGFSVDYDDDLASTAVSMDLFKTGANTLLEQTKAIQARKADAMASLRSQLPDLEAVEPITPEELQPFLQALLSN